MERAVNGKAELFHRLVHQKEDHDLATIPFLTIWDMIEFLEENVVHIVRDPKTKNYLAHFYQLEYNYTRTSTSKNLCERCLTVEEVMKIADNKCQNVPGSKSNAQLTRYVK
jgi:hypothetical protein